MWREHALCGIQAALRLYLVLGPPVAPWGPEHSRTACESSAPSVRSRSEHAALLLWARGRRLWLLLTRERGAFEGLNACEKYNCQSHWAHPLSSTYVFSVKKLPGKSRYNDMVARWACVTLYPSVVEWHWSKMAWYLHLFNTDRPDARPRSLSPWSLLAQASLRLSISPKLLLLLMPGCASLIKD